MVALYPKTKFRNDLEYPFIHYDDGHWSFTMVSAYGTEFLEPRVAFRQIVCKWASLILMLTLTFVRDYIYIGMKFTLYIDTHEFKLLIFAISILFNPMN